MDTYEAITTRRSVRKFKSDPLSVEQIWRYLNAANLAPTATNRQPWSFYVITRKHLDNVMNVFEEAFSERLADAGRENYGNSIKDLPIPTNAGGDKVEGMQNFFRGLGGAPVAVMVCTEISEDKWRDFFNIQDAAAAIENLILAAWADGVGSCWMCGHFVKKADVLKNIFNIPENQRLVAIVPLGYPDDVPKAPPKVDVKTKTTWFD